MKIKNISDVKTFLATVNSCDGGVTLTSMRGDNYNLKSEMSQYLAVAALHGEHGDELELWCTDRADEAKFAKMFYEHPNMHR